MQVPINIIIFYGFIMVMIIVVVGLVHLKINNGCVVILFKSISHLVSQTTSILANAPTDPFHSDFQHFWHHPSLLHYTSKHSREKDKGRMWTADWLVDVNQRATKTCLLFRPMYTPFVQGTPISYLLHICLRRNRVLFHFAVFKEMLKKKALPYYPGYIF